MMAILLADSVQAIESGNQCVGVVAQMFVVGGDLPAEELILLVRQGLNEESLQKEILVVENALHRLKQVLTPSGERRKKLPLRPDDPTKCSELRWPSSNDARSLSGPRLHREQQSVIAICSHNLLAYLYMYSCSSMPYRWRRRRNTMGAKALKYHTPSSRADTSPSRSPLLPPLLSKLSSRW